MENLAELLGNTGGAKGLPFSLLSPKRLCRIPIRTPKTPVYIALARINPPLQKNVGKGQQKGKGGMGEHVGGFMDTVGSIFRGSDTLPWCDRDIIAIRPLPQTSGSSFPPAKNPYWFGSSKGRPPIFRRFAPRAELSVLGGSRGQVACGIGEIAKFPVLAACVGPFRVSQRRCCQSSIVIPDIYLNRLPYSGS
jgi:hypothetical protein